MRAPAGEMLAMPEVEGFRGLTCLMSAYSCEPGRGSEPGSGWQWASSAARDSRIILLTRPHRAELILSEIKKRELNIELIPVPSLRTLLPLRRRGRAVYLDYVIWQWRASRRARQLVAERQVHVMHHLTFASDSMPSGLSRIRDVPLVWGPVGGYARLSPETLKWLPLKDKAREILRWTVTGLMRRSIGRTIARRSTIVIAQNRAVAEQFGSVALTIVEPNIALPESPRTGIVRENFLAVFVGRLEAFKGAHIAVHALAKAQGPWRLEICGQGREEAQLRLLVGQLRLTDRVVFRGQLPRNSVSSLLSRASVMVFPTMRDSAGWAVGEAQAVGCPVLTTDAAGPTTIVAEAGGVALKVDASLIDTMASSLDRIAGGEVIDVTADRWSESRLPGFLTNVYSNALGRSRSGPVKAIREPAEQRTVEDKGESPTDSSHSACLRWI
jgi:glycosyltransferase involved in cell wall biosynthesis